MEKLQQDIKNMIDNISVPMDELNKTVERAIFIGHKHRHRNNHKWKRKLTTACISVGLTAATLFGLSFTTFAKDIPILSSIFNFFNGDGLYENYHENAKNLGITQEDNGIKVTVKEAVFDGQNIFITYDIESQKDLGKSPFLSGIPQIKGAFSQVESTTHKIIKKDKNHYVGITIGHLYSDEEKGHFEFNLEGFMLHPETHKVDITGNWNFKFDLKATKNSNQVVNQKTEKKGVTVAVRNITYTPMSFNIYCDGFVSNEIYGKWDFVFVGIEVKDNLGNIYRNNFYGGDTNSDIFIQPSNSFEKLNPKATSLIITPVVRLLDANKGSKGRSRDSNAPKEEFKLKEIVVKIKK
ncbi:DUF4179 domain-containing protein [Bacillus sp. FJAT-49736]|uniref:DUF4179 domain-containing protein n=1 Tax=Bacillus sp. FJAT-49736 TaxID=2833582 RepID=UPI001BC8F0CB|nr:DUF4179 domain-containing protein [Bacillus sp. FJAT-49736]MBS4175595.1 DUF4179 domain-containing protein [Bacillus sp. FJAT-49736]